MLAKVFLKLEKTLFQIQIKKVKNKTLQIIRLKVIMTP